MTLQIGMITFDTLNPRKLAAWWAEALGGQIVADMEGHFVMVAPPGEASPNLGFQEVADPTPGKNRLHLDFGSSDRAATVDHLVAAGATVTFVNDNPEFSWTTLADPDGNLFCVSDAKH
jgi:catechol 2,3-dioxygenase-like lactoylglutathione lyase family enzyme